MPLLTLLIIDDDPAVTRSFARSLREDAAVVQANDGHTALRLLDEVAHVDGIVLDITMPDYDAVEFLRDFKKLNLNVPIALMSGWNAEVLLIAGKLAKLSGHNLVGIFQKPLPPEKLLAAFRNV